MIFINVFYGTYFVCENDNIKIFKEKDILEAYIQNKNIIINNSDSLSKIDNILDIRIFNWLIDNYCYYNYLCEIKDDINLKNMKFLFKKQKKYIILNSSFIRKAIEYTNYYKVVNKLFNIDNKINRIYYYKLLEEQRLKLDVMKKLNQSFNEELNISNILKIKYSFINKIGRIYPNNMIIQILDRKKHIELFKLDKNKEYYLIDFTNFYSSFLYLYTQNEIYINPKFYNIYAKKYNISRDHFKGCFLSWLNGAGQKTLNNFLTIFNSEFEDIIRLKSTIKNFKFTNIFGHNVYFEKDYCKIGTLLQSTADDFLLRFYKQCYDRYYNIESIDFIFNLFDEFFIGIDKKYNINDLFSFVKIINFNIERY